MTPASALSLIKLRFCAYLYLCLQEAEKIVQVLCGNEDLG